MVELAVLSSSQSSEYFEKIILSKFSVVEARSLAIVCRPEPDQLCAWWAVTSVVYIVAGVGELARSR